MEQHYLTLKQNLCSAKIFLNTFGLSLETSNVINEFSKLKIFNKNKEVGLLYFENGYVKIESMTSLGKLNASYEIATFDGFNDIEFGGIFASWAHTILFEVKGKQTFSGDMRTCASIDTKFGGNCSVHCTIKYIDENNNEVILNLMDGGKPFSYDASKKGFTELLEIDPWSDCESYMYHIIREGEYDYDKNCFPNESVKFVWHNGNNDKNHLRTVSHIVENSKTVHWDSLIYDSVEKKGGYKSTIQKGLLMQKIDTNFSKKISELISLFKRGDISFLENLISVTFHSASEEEKKALFGVNIERIIYYNGADNLLDAYFDIKENDISQKKGFTQKYKKITNINEF